LIRATSLAKHFGALRAVDGIDLDIHQGEFFAFLGPNAAGKTTTIKMLTGLLRPSAGRVEIGGIDIQAEPERAKAQLAYVPDFPFLYEKLTSSEFMQFVGELYAMDRRIIDQRMDDLFERFHLKDYAHEITENLSHGTRQRLVIASALLHEPRVFIIDEPMVGLDPMHARIVKEEFKARAQAGMTIFLSTHQLSVAEEMADRIAIIHRGRIIALGTVEELRAQAHEGGGLEKVFLSLIDAEEQLRERTNVVVGEL
jgi:ABC-2 type transport system ATP-binding protein